MHYFKLHINDYAQATAHLTLIEDAVYTRLLRKYYADEKPLPADVDRLQRLVGARSREEKAAVQTVLAEFFFRDGDFFRNKRADEELAEYEAKSLKAKDSAHARWMRTHTERNVDAMPTQSEGNANHKPITNNHKKEREKANRGSRLDPAAVLTPEYEDFCRQERPDLDPRVTFERFKDYWISIGGDKGSKRDWLATWRNWVRNERSQKKSLDDSWARKMAALNTIDMEANHGNPLLPQDPVPF